MTPTTVTLPDPLKDYVEAQVAAGGYGSAGEYIRDLIRRDQERQMLRRLILEGVGSGAGDVIDDAWFERLRDETRAAGAKW